VSLALLTQGHIGLRPAGVQIEAYVTQSVPDAPLFGLDVENGVMAGLDVGAWGTVIAT